MKQSKPNHILRLRAANIGSMAMESLADVQCGTVFGVNSGGIFIKTESKWLNFISFERFRGPLTINLANNEGNSSPIKVGMELIISPQKIVFPEADFEISLEDAKIWLPETPSNDPSEEDDRKKRMIALAINVLETHFTSGLAPLLPVLLELNPEASKSRPDYTPLQGNILDLYQETTKHTGFPNAAIVIDLLGSGIGLTPSGDDFVIGMLLALNRWKGVLFNLATMDQYNRQIVEAAYHKTTTLSANLIECATLGLGDERLIDALDWLISGSEQESDPSEDLLSWGSSSGIDVFVGYVAALSNQPLV